MVETRVMIWNEFRHEKADKRVADVYPNGIHEAIAQPLRNKGFQVRTATLDEPRHGLTTELLDDTDVLIWWGHMAHGEVSDEVVNDVADHILNGMGLIVLHSAHFSKLFKKMMGTSCNLKWRAANDNERLWVVNPSHPIAVGLGECIDLPNEEMYGEHFDIPVPDELVFVSWFKGGEVFRSGCTYRRGLGKIFYFRPGHEVFPTYHNPEIQKVIANAVHWASPSEVSAPTYGMVRPREEP